MDVTNLIGSLGFPIVMCFMLFKYMNKERETHALETEKLRDILQKNTEVLKELKDILLDVKKG